MEPINHKEIVDEVYGFIKVYSDGTVERPPFPGGYRPACSAFVNGIASKDVSINVAGGLWARLFLPEAVAISQKRMPVVLYFHGGGFCTGSPDSASFHKFCSIMAVKSESIWVSVNYRLAPENRLPAAFTDGLAAVMWIGLQSELQELHSNGKNSCSANGHLSSRSIAMHDGCTNENGSGLSFAHDGAYICGYASPSDVAATCKPARQHDPSRRRSEFEHVSAAAHVDGDKQMPPDQWLLKFADFSNCFLAGESAGGAIVHNLMASLSRTSYSAIQIRGLLLIHSAFLVKGLYDESLNPHVERRPATYRQLCLPIGAPLDHPFVNPFHPEAYSFKDIKFPPAFIAVADQDGFYEASMHYAHMMKQHGHMAELQISNKEGHCFYLYKPRSKKAIAFYECLAAFMHSLCKPQWGKSLL